MALQKTIVLPSGVEVIDAYHRVIGGSFTKTSMVVEVETHKDAVTRGIPLAPIRHQAFMLDVSPEGMSIADIYTQLKLLDEFANSVDV